MGTSYRVGKFWKDTGRLALLLHYTCKANGWRLLRPLSMPRPSSREPPRTGLPRWLVRFFSRHAFDTRKVGELAHLV